MVRLVAAALASLLAGCLTPPPTEGAACTEECRSGELCIEGECRALCVIDADCAGNEVCWEGACWPRSAVCDIELDCERPATCGDNRLDGAELCDGSALRDQTCLSLGFDGGTLACANTCLSFDIDACSGEPTCGDGFRVEPELCDTTELGGESCEGLGFTGGTLDCAITCDAYDRSACTGGCGNDVVEGTEVCDGGEVNGVSCESEGFAGGPMRCTAACDALDRSGCVAVTVCGDGVRTGTEVCDETDVPGTCMDNGFPGGTLGCLPDCTAIDTSPCLTSVCGNGTREPEELCDGGLINGHSCQGEGRPGGTLACSVACSFDLGGCSLCGDGVIGVGEVCDGTNRAGQTCNSLGLGTGELGCTATCQGFVTSGCSSPPVCGNDVAEAGETCDGVDIRTAGCQSQGFTGGTLLCAAGCAAFDLSSCFNSVCGNNSSEPGEGCDDGNTVTETCAYPASSCTVCAANCQNGAGTPNFCGDNNLDNGNGENCDQGSSNGAGNGFCTADCLGIQSCGNGVREGTEVCDGAAFGPGDSCPGQGFIDGLLRCVPGCAGLDIHGCCPQGDLGSNLGLVASGPIDAQPNTYEPMSHSPGCTAGGGGGRDITFTWTPPWPGRYTANTFGTTFDTVLSVHYGCGDTAFRCNDDTYDGAGSGVQSQIYFDVFPNEVGFPVIFVVDAYLDTGVGIYSLYVSHEPPVCANEYVADDFNRDIVGCAESVLYADRGSLCGEAWVPCPFNRWVTFQSGGARPPSFNYWVDEWLGYGNGGGPGACHTCPDPGVAPCTDCTYPMRIAVTGDVAAGTDGLGNTAGWYDCGFATDTPNMYFGGCEGSPTAGTLCCRP